MTTVPSFNFDAFKPTFDDAAVAAELSKRDRLQAGEHTLEILDASCKGYTEKEPTWLKFSLVLGRPGTKAEADGKFKGAQYHTVLVPTVDITYNGGLNVFGMLQSFFAGLGQRLQASNAPELIKQYFADFKGLVGMKLKVTLGYQGNYVTKIDDKWTAVDKAGKPLSLSSGNGFDSYDAAFGAASVDGIKVERYLNVTRILPGDLQEPAKKDEKKTRKPTVSFGE
jgi:hypothetical protein